VLHHVGGALPMADEAVRLELEDEGTAEEPESEEPDADEEAGDEPEDFSHVRPGIVHRLDKDTSGVMVVAKNPDAQVFLARQFADRTATREYWAIVWGQMKVDEGEIEGNIARDRRDRKRFVVSQREGKWALTRWRVIERFEFATLVALRLATGRTHQIRVHCAHIGHPIFGDPTYGGRSVVYQSSGARHRQHVANLLKLIDRQALHARMLGVWHPVTHELMEFTSELPDDMQKLIAALRGT
jgi:23S rRNA pseudouridine1911/1915/1917 synthase